jgi:hypothetical protein
MAFDAFPAETLPSKCSRVASRTVRSFVPREHSDFQICFEYDKTDTENPEAKKLCKGT